MAKGKPKKKTQIKQTIKIELATDDHPIILDMNSGNRIDKNNNL
jgi:hypothetical protein